MVKEWLSGDEFDSLLPKCSYAQMFDSVRFDCRAVACRKCSTLVMNITISATHGNAFARESQS